MMSPNSRPVKVACLTCRASKIRCDGQNPCSSCYSRHEECRYQPSRRGGARRGPLAAQQLAQKRAHILANHSNVVHSSRPTVAPSFASSLSPDEPGPRTPNTLLETCDVGFSTPVIEIGETQNLLAAVDFSSCTIRAYRCDEDLFVEPRASSPARRLITPAFSSINAYYIFIHPYFPLLPPPAVPQYEDKRESLQIRSFYANTSDLPYCPTSSLGLALAAILVLIPPPGDALPTGGYHANALRHTFADLFARSALESVEDKIGFQPFDGVAKGPRSTLHCGVPQWMEPVLALTLLSVYEYCQHGNVPKMRVRANQALTTAMDFLLHIEDDQASFLDARRRCWWSIVCPIPQRSFHTQLSHVVLTEEDVYRLPVFDSACIVIGFDDPRIATQFPEFRGCREPWPLLVKAQSTLLRSCTIGRQFLRETHSNAGIPRTAWQDIQNLDSYIVELAAEVDRFRCVTNYQGAEADASRNLWAISNALIHTSRLTLHRVRAFLDRPVISDRHCDLLAIDTALTPSQTENRFYLSTARIGEIRAFFPFTEQESLGVCLHSSLVVSRVFRRLPSPNPMYSDTSDVEAHPPWSSRRFLDSPRSIPLMACCQMQAFCVMSMVLRLVRAAVFSGNLNSYLYLLDRPSATTDVQSTERLIEEIELGLETLGRSLQADSIFEGMRSMAKEAERLYAGSITD